MILNSNTGSYAPRRATKKQPVKQPTPVDPRKNGSREEQQAWMRDKQAEKTAKERRKA